jgi:hypothetical protein
MPKTRVRPWHNDSGNQTLERPVPADSPPNIDLAEHVVIAFHASSVAPVVRLKQLGLVA